MSEHEVESQESGVRQNKVEERKGLNFVLELAPLLVFLITYKLADLITATAVLVILTLISLLISWVLFKKLSTMPVVTAVIVTVFGGLTVYLQDETFIKMKPTIVYVLFAGALIVMRILGRGVLNKLLGAQLDLPDHVWKTLETAWIIFFIVLAIGNELIWRNFSTDFWVYFKFALFPVTLIFSVATILFGMKAAGKPLTDDLGAD